MLHKNSNKIQISPQEKLLHIINCIIMALAVVICIYPFYYLIIYSLSDPAQASRGVFLLPKGFSLQAYRWVFRASALPHAFFISISRTVINTALCLLGSSMFAYLVTKQEMIGRKVVYRFVIITMYLDAGLIPWYFTMKNYHLNNSFWLYVIPGIVNAYFVILIKTFIEQIPASLEESAQIDGAGFFRTFFSIILPLSKPILATVAIYASVGAWNAWRDNYLLVQSPKLQTVQLILYNCINQAQTLANSMKSGMTAISGGAPAVSAEGIRMATTIVATLPIILVYPFLQKYFVKGVMMGAVKG